LNALAPVRAGDLWRIAFVSRVERRHLVTSGGSVILEKAFDGAALGAVGLLALGSNLPDRRWLLLLVAGLGAGLGLAVAVKQPASRRVLKRGLAELDHLRHG